MSEEQKNFILMDTANIDEHKTILRAILAVSIINMLLVGSIVVVAFGVF